MSAAVSKRLESKATQTQCPYCCRPLRWVAMRWLARGVFECDRCGEFPDFRLPLRERLSAELASAEI